MGVKTAVLHFPHPYADTKEFIDVNVYPNLCSAADDIAEFMVRRLHDAGVYSGSIGITISGSGCCTEEREETRVFRAYMEKHYPEYTVLKGVLEGVYTDQGAADDDGVFSGEPGSGSRFGIVRRQRAVLYGGKAGYRPG